MVVVVVVVEVVVVAVVVQVVVVVVVEIGVVVVAEVDVAVGKKVKDANLFFPNTEAKTIHLAGRTASTAGWLADSPVVLIADWLAEWLAGWLADWLAG